MADIKTCTVSLNNGARTVECRQGMTLFAGLRTNKIFLPTGCGAKGVCGQCRVKVLSGPANPHTESELALISDADRAAGVRLGCQLRLEGDLTLEVSEPILHARQFKATITDIKELTHDIRRFTFTPSDGATVEHDAGQFINVMVKIPEAKAVVVRCFSFATPSSVTDRVESIIRLNPNGTMTPYLFNQAKAGDEVTLFAPFGTFRLSDNRSPCIWIAGGSGLSPFLGMVQDMIDKGIDYRPVQLFFGAVLPTDLYYLDVLGDIMAKHSWFKFIPALSGPEKSPQCADYGLITDVVAKYVKDASTSEGYLCGSPGMIGACIKVLTGCGMPADRIYFDRFC